MNSGFVAPTLWHGSSDRENTTLVQATQYVYAHGSRKYANYTRGQGHLRMAYPGCGAIMRGSSTGLFDRSYEVTEMAA